MLASIAPFSSCYHKLWSPLFKGKVITCQPNLAAFETAVMGMFEDMNEGFVELVDWDLQGHPKDASKTTASFLNRFDAIFTLNQDLLLEEHYLTKSDISLIVIMLEV